MPVNSSTVEALVRSGTIIPPSVHSAVTALLRACFVEALVGDDSATVWQVATLRVFQPLWLVAVVGGLLYWALVFGGMRTMATRKPFDLRTPMVAWNWFLSLFNGLVALYVVPHCLALWSYHKSGTMSKYQLLCTHDPFALHAVPGTSYPTHVNWIANALGALFCMSKLPELIDTLFVVLRKRPVITLHWWHHATVLWFCFYIPRSTLINEGGRAMWFVAMNAFVHFVMYGYYALMGMRFRVPGAAFITSIQIAQMVAGVYLEVETYRYCSGSSATNIVNYCGLAMYASYWVLFTHYALNRYVFQSKQKGE